MFDPAIYAARREAYMRSIGPQGVAVVRSLPERVRNGDVHYVFRQHSDLIYLTGFEEPEATLVLRPGAETEKVVMFVRPSDPEAEIWDGRRAGLDGAKQRYGADAAYPAAELAARLWELIANTEELHYCLGLDDEMDRMIGAALVRLRKLEKRGKRPPRVVVDPRVGLHELRLHKRPEELAALGAVPLPGQPAARWRATRLLDHLDRGASDHRAKPHDQGRRQAARGRGAAPAAGRAADLAGAARLAGARHRGDQ